MWCDGLAEIARRCESVHWMVMNSVECKRLYLGSAPSADKPRVPYGEGLLWKIEGRGIEPGYLFGTIHLEDPRVTRLPPVAQDVFNGATRLITEVEMHPAARARYAERMHLSRSEPCIWQVKGVFCAIWRPLVIGFHEYSDILAATPPQVVIRCRSVLPP
ncbi:MAG: TraB/GumN family protein [Thiogranum sp.]